MIILALDLSINATGWAVFQDSNILDFGVIKTKKAASYKDKYPKSTVKKAIYATEEIKNIIQKYNPEVIVYEEINPGSSYRKRSVVTIKALSFIHGYIFKDNLDIIDRFEAIKSSEWRSTLGLPNRGDRVKSAAIELVNNTYGLQLKFEDDDIADAICQARAYLIRKNII
jgi:Holliday junction resolvasome RuvABC endonuclease subunit